MNVQQPSPSPSEARRHASEPVFIVLGRIQRPHGVRGELRIRIIIPHPENIARLETVYIGEDPDDAETASAFAVQGARRHRDVWLVSLEGISNRDEAELYRGRWLMMALADALPLAEGEYYHYQVLGARAVTTDGEDLGQVEEVIETGANDVFVLRGSVYGEVLIPVVPHVVLEIDTANRRIVVEPIPGLLPD